MFNSEDENVIKNEAYVEKRNLVSNDLHKQCNNFFTSDNNNTVHKSSRP